MTYPSSKRIALGIIILAVFGGLFLVKNMFDPGALLNGEQITHFSLYQCFKDGSSFSFINAYCPYLPQFNSFLNLMPPFMFMIDGVLGWIFPLEFAHKLMNLLAWIFLPSCVFLVLYRVERYVAATISFLLIFFLHANITVFGFEFLFLFGGAHWYLGWGFFVLTVCYAYHFFEHPSKDKLPFLILLTTLLFLAHVLIFLFFSVIFVFLYVRFRPRFNLIAWYVSTVGLLVSFWFIPLIGKFLFFRSHDLWSQSMTGGMSSWITNIQLLANIPIIFLPGFVGIIMWLQKRDKIQSILWLMIYMIGIVFLVSPFPLISSVVVFSRTIPLFIILLAVGIGLVIEWFIYESSWISEEKYKSRKFLIALILVGGMIFVHISNISRSADFLLTTNSDRLGFKPTDLYNPISDLIRDSPGRILVEDFYDQKIIMDGNFSLNNALYATRFWIPLALRSKKEVISGFQTAGVVKGQKFFDSDNLNKLHLLPTFNRMSRFPFKQFTDKNNDDTLKYLNVNFVLVSEQNREIYDKFPEVLSSKRFKLYYANATNYFSVAEGHGVVVNESSNGLVSKAIIRVGDKVDVIFHEPLLPNWVIRSDGKIVAIRDDAVGSVVFSLPAGLHKVSVSYELLWYEYLGWFLTAIGLCVFALIVWNSGLFKINQVKAEHHEHIKVEKNVDHYSSHHQKEE